MGQTTSNNLSTSSETSETSEESTVQSKDNVVQSKDDVVSPNTVQLYVLKHGNVQSPKYYVGITTDFTSRLEQHKSGRGAAWTKLHQPIIETVQVVPLRHKLDEDNMVKQLMMAHEIDNVRGGTYSQVKLSAAQLALLHREFNHANGKCISCGGNHYVRDCKARNDTLHNDTLHNDTASLHSQNSKRYCAYCGRNFHHLHCKYHLDRNNNYIGLPHGFCSRCGRRGHQRNECYAKSTYDNVQL